MLYWGYKNRGSILSAFSFLSHKIYLHKLIALVFWLVLFWLLRLGVTTISVSFLTCKTPQCKTLMKCLIPQNIIRDRSSSIDQANISKDMIPSTCLLICLFRLDAPCQWCGQNSQIEALDPRGLASATSPSSVSSRELAASKKMGFIPLRWGFCCINIDSLTFPYIFKHCW